jgi:hypothetical protein
VTRAPGPLHRLGDRLYRPERLDRYGSLLVLLLALYGMLALPDAPWQRSASGVVAATVMFLALRTSGVSARTLRAVVWLLAAGAVLTAASGLVEETGRWLGSSIVGGMLLVAPVVILRRVLQHRVVTLATIGGAVCVYILIGIIFTYVLVAVDAAVGGDLLLPPADGTSTHLYLSFITLTTVGFGNVVARGSGGETILVIEALLGQIFLVTTVARLVSLFGQVRPGAAPDDLAPEGPGDPAPVD